MPKNKDNLVILILSKCSFDLVKTIRWKDSREKFELPWMQYLNLLRSNKFEYVGNIYSLCSW